MSEQLKSRTKRFALDVIELSAFFPKQLELRHVIGQVLRSSSSVAANYRAAYRARSSAEFLSKLGIVEEECDETQFWLELLRDSSERLKLRMTAHSSTELERLIKEADELLRITIAAKKTTRAKLGERSAKFEVRSSNGKLKSATTDHSAYAEKGRQNAE